MPPSPAAGHVRQLYRETLRRARALGGDRGLGAVLEARSSFRKLAHLDDAGELTRAIAQAESRLSYLRVMTPRFAGGGSDGRSAVGKFIVRDGAVSACGPVDRDAANSKKPLSSYGGSNVDPEAVRRHEALVERQHFGGPFWEGKRR